MSFSKQGHVTYVSDKSVSHVSTSCSAERTAEREIFTFAFVSDSKGSQLRFSSCSAKESCERNLHCVSLRKEGHTVYVSDKAVSHVSTSCSAEKKSCERNPHFVSLEKKATLCIYICWRFFCLKSRWFVFLVERISFSVQNQLHLPLQSTVPFSSSLSPVLRRRAGPKLRCHRKSALIIHHLFCPSEGIFNLFEISEYSSFCTN